MLLSGRGLNNWVGLRFVNEGKLYIRASSIIVADEVIASLSPHIRADQN